MTEPRRDAENPSRTTPSAFDSLLRWEDSGGTWAVLRRGEDDMTLSLRTCTADEEVDRLTTAEPEVIDHVGDRDRSDD